MLFRNYSSDLRIAVWVAMVCATGVVSNAQEESAGPIIDLRETVEGLAPAGESGYAIGVRCRPIRESLRRHLKLSDDEGVMVGYVVAKSPAAAAGVERFDVLLKANEEQLTTVRDVSRAVRKSEGKPIHFELIHNGEMKNVSVTPAPRSEVAFDRPERGRGWMDHLTHGMHDVEELQKWLERFQPGPEGSFHLRGLGPGISVKGTLRDLPTGVSISISKEGDSPAKIKVRRKRGDDEDLWKVTEKTIGELPEDLLPLVQRLFGQNVRIRIGSGSAEHGALPPRSGVGGMDRRLETMERRMEKMLDELRGMRSDKDREKSESK